jgi:hypothetical protein
MGHRDLLVTHNLSEGKNHERRLYLRGSVRRASGFVLTGFREVGEPFQAHTAFHGTSALEGGCACSLEELRKRVSRGFHYP